MKRPSLLEEGYTSLAIADVVHVEGVGTCSHQPLYHKAPPGLFTVVDVEWNIHEVPIERIFIATREESITFWNTAS